MSASPWDDAGVARREGRYREVEARYLATESIEPEERRVELASTRTSVRVLSVGDGAPVLFVHGASTSGAGWAPLAARLTGHRRLLLDRPGCGLSDPLDEPRHEMTTFEPFADALVADVLDALAIDRADVVATSLGAYFALRAAAAHPDRIGRLVLVAFPIGARVTHTPWSMRMTAVPGLGRLMTRLPVGERMARSMLRQLGLGPALDTGQLPPEGIAWFRSVINDTGTMRHEIDAMPPLVHPRHGLSPELVLDDELLARITAPTLFLWGTADPIGGADVARAFAPKIAGARLDLLPDAGHVPWLDAPDAVAAEVDAFLRRG